MIRNSDLILKFAGACANNLHKIAEDNLSSSKSTANSTGEFSRKLKEVSAEAAERAKNVFATSVEKVKKDPFGSSRGSGLTSSGSSLTSSGSSSSAGVTAEPGYYPPHQGAIAADIEQLRRLTENNPEWYAYGRQALKNTQNALPPRYSDQEALRQGLLKAESLRKMAFLRKIAEDNLSSSKSTANSTGEFSRKLKEVSAEAAERAKNVFATSVEKVKKDPFGSSRGSGLTSSGSSFQAPAAPAEPGYRLLHPTDPQTLVDLRRLIEAQLEAEDRAQRAADALRKYPNIGPRGAQAITNGY